MFTRLKRLLTKIPKQYLFCYCPMCRNELVSSRGDLDETSFVKYFDEYTVHYRCKRCLTQTRWLFDGPVVFILEIKDRPGSWHKMGGAS